MSVKNLLGNITSGNDKPKTEFDEHQTQQLLAAEQNGVLNTECQKHPDWSGTLMNVCWNLEKEGGDVSVIYRIADYLQSNFGRYKLCNDSYWNDPILLTYLKECYSSGRLPIPPVYDDNHVLNKLMTDFKYTVGLYSMKDDAEYLTSGRLCLNNVGEFYTTRVMAEGVPGVEDICSQLQSLAAQSAKEDSRDPWGTMANRGFNMLSIMLTLDDMGIRGHQILYASEYASGSSQKLFEILCGNRSQQLVDFVNHRTAEDFVANKVSIPYNAVTDGASFSKKATASNLFMYGANRDIKLIMDEQMIVDSINKEVVVQSIDYSKLDITHGVGTEDACKICAAHGFVIMRTVPVFHGRDREEGVSVIMWNPHNNDFLSADYALLREFCYGGCSITAYRSHRNGVVPGCSGSYLNCSSGPLDKQDGIRYYDITYHDGLFAQYAKLTYDTDVQVDYSLVSFGSSYDIPVPEYFSLPTLYGGTMPQVLGKELFFLINDMGSFYFNRFMNLLLALYDDALLNCECPHYKRYQDWFWNGGAGKVLSTDMSEDDIALASIAITYLGVDDEFRDKLADSFVKCVNSRHGRYYGYEKKQDLVKREKMIRKNLTNHHPLYTKLVDGYGLPHPSGLPIVMPWFKEGK